MSSADTLFAQASDALRNQDPERATDLCARARQQDPDDPRLVMLHGFALRRSGHHAEAEPLLRRTLGMDPGLEIAHHELGLALKGPGASERGTPGHGTGCDPEPQDDRCLA